ncbi:MAG: hypothetical protein JWO94_3538 [Verrucomicrobiaceae bacterium]|nr:hypothetical protein [Verrucomicrobiaceae bacterium]
MNRRKIGRISQLNGRQSLLLCAALKVHAKVIAARTLTLLCTFEPMNQKCSAHLIFHQT